MSEESKKQLKILIEAAVDDAFLLEQEGGVFYKAFVEPFTDVIKTARHGLESSIQSVVRNSRKVAMQFAAAAIPFIAPAEITRIGKDESEMLKQKLGQLDADYGEVLDRNIQALQGKDPAAMAFLLNPALALGVHAGAWAAGKGVGTASNVIAGNLEFLGILTRHVPVVGALATDLSKKFDTLSTKASDFGSAVVSKPISGDGGGGGYGGGGGGYGGDYGDDGGFGDGGEAVSRKGKPMLREQGKDFTTAELNTKIGTVLQKFLARPDVIKAMQTSPLTKALGDTAVESVLKRARQVAAISTIEQFKSFAGPEFSKYEAQIEAQMPQDMDPEALKAFEAEQVTELKRVYKGIYQKYLKDMVGKTPALADSVNKALKVLNNLG